MSKSFFNIQSFSVYVSTTLVLVLLGVMLALFFSARSLSDYVRKNLVVSAVLNNKIDEKDILSLQQQLNSKSFVNKAQYISAQQILEQQKVELGTDPVEFLGYNPYDPSIEIYVKPQYANSDSLAKIKNILLGDKRINEIIYQKDIVDTVNRNINKIAIVLLVFLALLTLISWSLIANMVRLSIYSQRFLLHTMKLVGATWGFVRRPFLWKNIKIGIVSGVAAVLLLGVLFYILTLYEPAIVLLLDVPSLLVIAFSVILFGVLITFLCAYSSVNRFLRMRGNDLYYI